MLYSFKISICVPVYNTAPYLPQCLGSLLSQTLQEIEILLVDDGSTDVSGQICDEYAQRDSRIRVFHKPNGGSASARQVAWDNMVGEYCIVCDSDDWVEPSMYEELYRKAKEEDADMVLCDFFYNYSDGRQVQANNIPTGCSQDALLRDVLTRRITGATWNKLVRTDIYQRYNLSWEKGINLGEDLLMFLKLLQVPLRIVSLPKPLYHYRRIMNANTYTNNLTLETYRQLERIFFWTKDNIDTKSFERELFSSSFDYAFPALRTKGMTSSYYNNFVRRYIPWSKYLKYGFISLKGFLILVSKVVGYKVCKLIVKCLYHYWYK